MTDFFLTDGLDYPPLHTSSPAPTSLAGYVIPCPIIFFFHFLTSHFHFLKLHFYFQFFFFFLSFFSFKVYNPTSHHLHFSSSFINIHIHHVPIFKLRKTKGLTFPFSKHSQRKIIFLFYITLHQKMESWVLPSLYLNFNERILMYMIGSLWDFKRCDGMLLHSLIRRLLKEFFSNLVREPSFRSSSQT